MRGKLRLGVGGALLASVMGCGGPPATDPPLPVAAASQELRVDELSELVSFDPALFQLPEGLAVSGRRVLVGLGPTSEVLRVDEDGETRTFGHLPQVEQGFMSGIAFGEHGVVFVGLVSLTPTGPASGIYRIAREGGDATLFATHPAMTFPNGVTAHGGYLFVADSASGSVLRISQATGQVEVWSQSALLLGNKDACPPAELPFDIGANGIAVANDGTVYVTNSDLATIVKIPRRRHGSAGDPQVVAGPACDLLQGGDGIVIDRDGSLLVTAHTVNTLVRVRRGRIEVLEEGGLLDFPANIAFGPDGTLLIANFALLTAQTPGAESNPGILEYGRTDCGEE